MERPATGTASLRREQFLSYMQGFKVMFWLELGRCWGEKTSKIAQ
jgi:hypothetical protein